MQADDGYDTTRFDAIRRDLSALNEAALADGLVAVRDGVVVSPDRPRRARRRAAARAEAAGPGPAPASEQAEPAAKEDRSPVAAARLLALLRRQDGDESPVVTGTAFTEAGVARLLAHLQERRAKRGGAWLRFLKRSNRYLSRPVPAGIRTVHGVSFERLQFVARQLAEIEANGWSKFREARRARRRKVAPIPALTQDDAGTEPAKSPRKGRKH